MLRGRPYQQEVRMRQTARLLKGMAVALSVAALSAVGCGSDDDGENTGGSGSDTTAAAVQACSDKCAAEEEAGCNWMSVDGCQEMCREVVPTLSAECQAAELAARTCELALPDICDSDAIRTECETERQAVEDCR